MDSINTLLRRFKISLPCPKQQVKITSINYNGNNFTVTFDDTFQIFTNRQTFNCNCPSSLKNKCKHRSKLCQRLFFPSTAVEPHHVHSRLSCLLLEPDCPICLEKALDNEIKNLADLRLSQRYLCDECGKVMHSSCCKLWRDSELGKSWEKRCFVCSSILVLVK